MFLFFRSRYYRLDEPFRERRLRVSGRAHPGGNIVYQKKRLHMTVRRWSGRSDSNRRPPVPKTGALPGCATPRKERARKERGRKQRL